jgi:PAS domain-containing protein
MAMDESTITNHLNHASIGGFVVNSKDVTERKNKADALVVSEQRFKALVQNGTDLIVIVDDQGNFSYISSNSSLYLDMIRRSSWPVSV